ncbi:hypothetical protein MHO82_24545 [Vibrio sp. Of7-15]|uniref:hypothetical protein n=1 Tax=Vibrio sp. Of7-15 TaxID=2724879 RepID=UPI001EF2CF64|nr:hypothetical protein [Vibrio sp. Of7-15]MCG7500037.1 hypothetical protein [Vibrio sp. Of7-15]
MSQFIATQYAHSLNAAGASGWFYTLSHDPKLGDNLAEPRTLDVSWIDKGNGTWLAPKIFKWLYLRQTINFMPFKARLEFSCKGVVKFNNVAYDTGRHSIDIPASSAYPRLLATQIDTLISDISLREILE